VVVGSAFACGGYSMALLVYIFNKGQYHPLVRPALLASLFGYTLAGAGVIFDLGRWWNVWNMYWPGSINPNSVMFEVAVCITLYIVVMWSSLADLLEKLGMKDVKQKLNKLLFFIAWVLLPSMHQSSLFAAGDLRPADPSAWQSGMLLPVIYLMTAILLGFAVVIFEATLSSTGFKRPLETKVLTPLAKVMYWTLAAYVVLRVLDLVFRGAFGTAFAATWQAFWFWVEMACFIVPLVTLASENARRSASKLFVGAVLLMLGGMLLRINGFLVGYMTGEGWSYFPSFAELMVTVGIIAFEILAYIVIVRNYPVLPAAQPATR
jgi:Ni/Fe-hydrogenase subunit HybB-like protein